MGLIVSRQKAYNLTVSRTLTLALSRYNKTLQPVYIRKYFKILKAKTTPKTQQLIIICTKVNIFLKLLD